jgi:hypothetical protein
MREVAMNGQARFLLVLMVTMTGLVMTGLLLISAFNKLRDFADILPQ